MVRGPSPQPQSGSEPSAAPSPAVAGEPAPAGGGPAPPQPQAPALVLEPLLPNLLSRTAQALFLLYGLNLAFSGVLPVHLFRPLWQLDAANALTDGALLPLLGLVLLHLAADLDLGNPRLQRFRWRVGRLARFAVLGFLLLIPLQISAGWRALHRLDGPPPLPARNLALMRQAVEQSRSGAELQKRLVALQAPPLTVNDMALPYPDLRRQMEAQIARVEERIARRRTQARPALLSNVLQRCFKGCLSALVLTFAFAAGVLARR